MKTKKEIRETYQCQLSMNRITDDLILKARKKVGCLACSTNYKMTIKNVVDCAYDLQREE